MSGLKIIENHPDTALALLLAKLRTGKTDEKLDSLFNVSRSSAEQVMSKVRSSLLTDFLPSNLRFQRLSREAVLHHSTVISRKLFYSDKNNQNITI